MSIRDGGDNGNPYQATGLKDRCIPSGRGRELKSSMSGTGRCQVREEGSRSGRIELCLAVQMRWKQELECGRSAAMEGATIGELKVRKAEMWLLELRRVDWQHLFERNREGLFPELDRAHLT